MTRSYFDHPSEEALERFLLHSAQEGELDRVETHILACDACVSRLEELEIQLAAVKLALQELSREPEAKAAGGKHLARDWFTFRTLSWAAAVAMLAVAVTLTPRFVSHSDPAVDVTLSANRGLGTGVVPLGSRLHLHLNAPDLANGPLHLVLVGTHGELVWDGAAKAQDDHVEITIPKLDTPGSHFLRLYAGGTGHSEGDLLREFAFEVK